MSFMVVVQPALVAARESRPALLVMAVPRVVKASRPASMVEWSAALRPISTVTSRRAVTLPSRPCSRSSLFILAQGHVMSLLPSYAG